MDHAQAVNGHGQQEKVPVQVPVRKPFHADSLMLIKARASQKCENTKLQTPGTRKTSNTKLQTSRKLQASNLKIDARFKA
jgi:hypothetical protein